MYKGPLFIVILILTSHICYGNIIINEIMYNPEGNDNNKEFIEIFFDEAVNLTGYYIEDSKSKDMLESLYYHNGSYALIVEEGFDYNGINASIYSVGATIGDNLNNNGDIIILRDGNENILDIVSYSDSFGADDNNKSLERVEAKGHSSDPLNWIESNIMGGTPGQENNNSKNKGCDWTVYTILSDTVFERPEFRIKVMKLDGEVKANMSVDKWIEDSKGNIDKTYSTWNIKNTLNYKTSSKYSPSLTKGNAYFIKANITNLSCEDYDLSNNFVSEMIFIMDEEENTNPNSSIHITSATENVKFGEIVNVKMNIYRGDTSKYAIYAYIEDDTGKKMSEKDTIHLKNKFTNYTLTIPIQLKPDCEGDYTKGKYIIKVEGLDTNDEKEIQIEGNKDDLCQTIEIEKEKKTSGKLSYDIIEMPSIVNLNESFDIYLKIKNDYDDDVQLDVWSYIYRGNKKYSIEKANLKHMMVEGEDTKEIKLVNKVIEGKEGTYKLKTKILKRGRKTTYDKTRDITLKIENTVSKQDKRENLMISKKNEELELNKSKNPVTAQIVRNEIVYESKTFFIKRFIPVFLTILFLLAVLFSAKGIKN